MSFDLKNEINRSGYCDKSQTGKHGWNNRRSHRTNACHPSGIELC